MGGKCGQPNEETQQEHERVVRAVPFVAGRVGRLFLVYFSLAAFEGDRTQVSSPIHTPRATVGCCVQHEIFLWEHHHGSNILAMATGHKGFPMCATR